MKNFKRILIVIIALVVVAAPASAQFRFGVKVGMNVSSLHFSEEAMKDVFDSENRTGFTGGLTAEFTVPIIGIGMDASLMYVHRVTNVGVDVATSKSRLSLSDFGLKAPDTSNDYLEIPINLKYKFNVPAVGSIITPYLFTGPSFAVLCSKKAINDAWENKALDIAWNIGVGVQLIKHIQIGASYGFGITKALEYVGPTLSDMNEPNVGRNNCWTVTAAWLF